jgi:hypothetical protein
LAKITVQRDQRSAFVLAYFEQCLAQSLIPNRDDIVTSSADQIGRALAEVLIKL